MILAAADLASNKSVEPPSDLITLWDWRDTGTPPNAGGLRDQPAGLLRRAKYLEAVYRVMARWYANGAKGFTDQDREIFQRVLKLRKEHKTNGAQR